jgi:hypothetical protein
MFTLKYPIIVLYLSLLTMNSFAQIRDFETTRLQSTSGAGVATILVNEASVLNPAPIVFVPVSSFYYQKGQSNFEGISAERNNPLSDGSSQMYLLSDSTSALKGTFSYQDHSENSTRRRRLTSSIASAVGKQTSFGLLYRYTIDNVSTEDKSYHQAVFGFTHVYSEQLIFGGVLIDPFLSNKDDTKAIVGFQYALTTNLFLIFDAGTNYHEKKNKQSFNKSALQISFFRDLYLRVGQYHDQISELKGKSWGISWIGPRLSLEYAFKTSEALSAKNPYYYKNEEIRENSISIALVF